MSIDEIFSLFGFYECSFTSYIKIIFITLIIYLWLMERKIIKKMNHTIDILVAQNKLLLQMAHRQINHVFKDQPDIIMTELPIVNVNIYWYCPECHSRNIFINLNLTTDFCWLCGLKVELKNKKKVI